MTPDENSAHTDHDDFGGLRRDAGAGAERKLARRRALPILGGIGLTGLIAACSSTQGATATSSTSASSSASTSAASAGTAAAGAAIPQETRVRIQLMDPTDPTCCPTERWFARTSRPPSTDWRGPRRAYRPRSSSASSTRRRAIRFPARLCTCGTAPRTASTRSTRSRTRTTCVASRWPTMRARSASPSIFPGCYRGRWPHMHFEVYESVDEANRGSNAIRTSQLALPQSDCEAAYENSDYGSSSSNLGSLSLSSDNVFADGWTDQLATVSGSSDAGYTLSLLVRV